MLQIIKRMYYVAKYRRRRVRIGKRCIIGGLKTVFEGNNVIGDNTLFSGFLGYGSYIGKNANIEAYIGRFCSIGSGIETVLGNHPSRDFVSTHPAFFSTKKQAGFTYVEKCIFDEVSYAKGTKYPVIIGNDVWIGQGCKLLNGITIGDGAIIAAGAVVTKDVEPYTIVGGIPAKVIRRRFSSEDIDFLVRFAWWNKPINWIEEHASLFSNIDRLKKYEESEI